MSDSPPSTRHHAVAIPFPGRGHINPMLHFCSLLAQRGGGGGLHITFIVTEEWLNLLTTSSPNNHPSPQKFTFLTVPNVIPSERIRCHDHPGFVQSVLRDMPGPVEQALDRLRTSQRRHPDVIIADTFLTWAVSVGSRRGIPVASFWPMCGSVLSVFYHRDLIGRTFPVLDISGGRGEEEEITSIPGIASIKLKDVPEMLHSGTERTLRVVFDAMDCLPKAQFLILRTVDELEGSAIEALKTSLPLPIYPIGPAIPYSRRESDYDTAVVTDQPLPDYIRWLNKQPERSVLYVALGSFVAVSRDQIDQLADGLKSSGEKVLWVARDETERVRSGLGERAGGIMVVEWCDQMRVLLEHDAIGGFLTHCGWNSTLETVFAGVPVLAWPLKADEMHNCKMMVDDWGVGWRLPTSAGNGGLVLKGAEVCDEVKRFMDPMNDGRRRVGENSRELKEKLRGAVAEDGSTTALQAFLSAAFRQ